MRLVEKKTMVTRKKAYDPWFGYKLDFSKKS